MGQYLALGIITRCSTSKKDSKEQEISKEELLAQLQQNHHFEPTIYHLSETEEQFIFDLKPEILENQLLPFLTKLYPILYNGSKEDFQDILKMLQTSEPANWLEKAEFEAFQLDRYGESEYLHFDKPYQSHARLSFSNIIMLSLEGKISMETYSRQFHFFKYCIQAAFTDFSLAKAIRVYITG